MDVTPAPAVSRCWTAPSPCRGRGVRYVFERSRCPRCQDHDRKFATGYPRSCGSFVQRGACREAYHPTRADRRAKLTALANDWTRRTPLRPRRYAKVYKRHSPCGRWAYHHPLALTLRATNPSRCLLSICSCPTSTNVKRWRDGQMACGWCASGLVRKPVIRSAAASQRRPPTPALFSRRAGSAPTSTKLSHTPVQHNQSTPRPLKTITRAATSSTELGTCSTR